MEMSRRQLISALSDSLGQRKLVWVGTRGHDSLNLMDVPQFSESYGLIATVGSLSLAQDIALEQLSRRRVDLDTYKVDEDQSADLLNFRGLILDSLREPAAVVAYRPSALLSALCYPRLDFVRYLGMFHERQATFEYKPWVETELRNLGIPTIPWRYYAEEDRRRLEERAQACNLVIRPNRTDGGAGVRIVSGPTEIGEQLSEARDGFIAATAFLDGAISLNANACLFKDGGISLHPASLQLIGIAGLTKRRFGYCGNDFGGIKEIDIDLLHQLDMITRETGRWLWSQGYVGSFGIDGLIHDGNVYLTEINPRLQGSSSLSARIDRAMGRCDIFLCHTAAHLGLKSPQSVTLTDIVKEQPCFAQILVHNLEESFVTIEAVSELQDIKVELLPAREVQIAPSATMYRAVLAERVTQNGTTVDADLICKLKALVTVHSSISERLENASKTTTEVM